MDSYCGYDIKKQGELTTQSMVIPQLPYDKYQQPDLILKCPIAYLFATQELQDTVFRELSKQNNVDVLIILLAGTKAWNESHSNYWHSALQKVQLTDKEPFSVWYYSWYKKGTEERVRSLRDYHHKQHK